MENARVLVFVYTSVYKYPYFFTKDRVGSSFEVFASCDTNGVKR